LMGSGSGGLGGIGTDIGKGYWGIMSGGTIKNGDPFGAAAGARNDIFGISDQAKYAQRAAEAEQAARVGVTNEARAARDRANAAAQSPQQLAALQRGLEAAQTQVETDLRQLAAIDPAIMEASKQVLDLLQGKEAAVNSPMMKQRAQQRQNLVNSLKSQYGPGAESSSIGARALQQFDDQTNTMFQQNQMATTGQMMGIASTRMQGPGFGQLMGVASGFGDYQNRILNAQQSGDRNVLAGMQEEVQGAGAQYVSDLLKAGGRRQWYTMMEDDGRQIGRTWATMGAGGKGGRGGNMSNAGQAFNTDTKGTSSGGGGSDQYVAETSQQYRDQWGLNIGPFADQYQGGNYNASNSSAYLDTGSPLGWNNPYGHGSTGMWG
jgi:hypothetical protein